MKNIVPFYQLLKRATVWLLIIIGSTVAFTASAQCPVAASCTPGGAPSSNHAFGMGIYNVTLSTISNTTGGVTQGYQNYSCTIGAILTAGVSYPISISTNTNVNENVRVWIDYNNNGVFDPITELAFSSDNKKIHTGTIIIPATAVTSQPLRMRVSADYIAAPIPTPCTSPQYSQVEDYKITALTNASSPNPNFSANQTTTCTGVVSFSDLTQNLPTSWIWNFGDGSPVSTLQNPTHTYTTPGPYTVTLTACNTAGCSTATKTNYITYDNVIPRPASCTPLASSYCCNYGITNFVFSSLSNPSANGSAGYEDFTCTKKVTVTEGLSYPVTVTTGTSNNHDVRIYIDYNNDGTFSSSERVYQALNTTNPTGTIQIAGGAVLNTPLRMRVIADFAGSSSTGCSGITHGQAEDYTITILQNTNPPTSQFTSNHATSCDTIVQFTDMTTNAPSSWKWYFGDGDSSSLQNPVHRYTTSGTYTVTLIACNSFGCDTIVKSNFVNITLPCIIYCPSNGHTNNSVWITNVQFGGINNTTTAESNGYGNYTAQQGSVIQGGTSSFSMSVNNTFFKTYSAWIDFNRNGVFETTEKVISGVNSLNAFTGNISIPSNALIGPTRMRVMIRTGSAQPTPCLLNQFNAEVEDYTIYVGTNTMPPVVGFKAASTTICNGIATFTDQSLNAPTSWSWDFGDGSPLSTLQNPTHTYSTPGNYTVRLTACNANGCGPTLVKSNYIRYDTTATICSMINMPTTGNAPVITRCTGTIYDSGGPTGTYSSNEDGTVTIAPLGAGAVRLDFTSFNLENCCDHLMIFDGPTINSPLIGDYRGNLLPNGGTIVANSGSVTLRMITDPSLELSGFAATFTCLPATKKPAANFTANFDNICNGVIPFIDNTTNGATSWQWNFGDGTTSTQKNPTHTYQTTSASTYNVTLIACNSFGCDTLRRTNYVNISVPCLTYCISNGHNNTNQWINNVTVGSINNSSGQNSNGYGNYTYLTTPVQIASTENFTITTGNNFTTNIAIWVDFNKDGIFQTTESVFSGTTQIQPNGTRAVTGSFQVPSNAALGRTRMRVIMNNSFVNNDPCAVGLFTGETEDYAIDINPNTLPTAANFSADLNSICTGLVSFKDNSTNGATSWSWRFGDGSTSTLQNPTHTYQTTTPTSYDVTLIACKGTQCDTITKTNYVTISVPCLTYCISNNHDNTNQWIGNVTIGAINNSTNADVNGYGNYTHLNTNLILGNTYPLTVTLGNNSFTRFISIWIDYNQDGVFQSTELAYSNFATFQPNGTISTTGNIVVPNNALVGRTRMRIQMSSSSFNPDPCALNIFSGEVEDYTVTIQPNALPVVTNFSADLTGICSGQISFKDLSANGATSWLWNFGDGTSSTQQHPSHTYQTTTPAQYNVTLIACKNGVCDTTIKNNFITIDVPCITYCTSNNHDNTQQWISNVTVGAINNNSGQDINAYGNYTYLSTPFVIGAQNINFSVTLGGNFTRFVNIWIDFNRDGIFQASERVYSDRTLFNSGVMSAVGSFNIPTNAVAGRTRMRVIMTSSIGFNNNACINSMVSGETEDYSIILFPNTSPPVATFTADKTVTCNGTVTFTDQSNLIPTSWNWSFGDGTTSTLQNPVHTYTSTGTYTVRLISCNTNGCDTLTKTNYIVYDPTLPACQVVTLPTSGTAPTATICSGKLLDSGGASSNYSDNENSVFTIAPTNAANVSLTFNSFNTETCCDFLSIYDGPTTGSPLIGRYSGFTLPNNGNPIISTGGALTIRFTSDFSSTGSGFDADWTCTLNNVKPTTNFTATMPTNCSGATTFQDNSTGIITSWNWNFGDGTTSSLKNPVHTYTSAGTYTVRLITCNAIGCDTLTRFNYVIVPTVVALTPMTACTPITATYCCGYGIANVSLNLINNSSGNASLGYENFTCSTIDTLELGKSYTLQVTNSSTLTENARAWIDFNNNGVFDSNEEVLTSNNATSHSATFTIPQTVAKGAIVRMRISSDESARLAPTACGNLRRGQAEDYSVYLHDPVGVKDQLSQLEFNVHPNPSNGEFYVQLKNVAGNSKLEVISLLGQIVHKREIDKQEVDKKLNINLTHLPTGVYLIRLTNQKGTGVRKIVIE